MMNNLLYVATMEQLYALCAFGLLCGIGIILDEIETSIRKKRALRRANETA